MFGEWRLVMREDRERECFKRKTSEIQKRTIPNNIGNNSNNNNNLLFVARDFVRFHSVNSSAPTLLCLNIKLYIQIRVNLGRFSIAIPMDSFHISHCLLVSNRMKGLHLYISI